jgi:hypothetical protein
MDITLFYTSLAGGKTVHGIFLSRRSQFGSGIAAKRANFAAETRSDTQPLELHGRAPEKRSAGR